MRLSLRRTGGLFAGNALEASVSEHELTDEERRQVREALEAADFERLAAGSPLTGQAADAYQYELAVERDGEPRRVVVSGRLPPEELRPLIEVLERRAVGDERP